MPKTTAEAIACGIVIIPMIAAMTCFAVIFISHGLCQFAWWKKVMVWWWGDWTPLDDNNLRDVLGNTSVVIGVIMLILPCLTILGYCLWIGQNPIEYIRISWEQIRFI